MRQNKTGFRRVKGEMRVHGVPLISATAEEGSDSEVSEIAPRLTPHLLLINASLP